MPLPLALLGAGVGLAQSIIGGIKAKKAQRELEGLQTPKYNQSGSIMDYYNQALSRYGVAPTESALYKRNMNNINRGVATGISSLNDRRSGQAGVSSILRAANDATLNTEVAAENERDQRFNTLGAATGMKANEEMKDFQYNQLAPYEKKYNLLALKAGANNQTANTGISNIFNSLQSMTNMDMLKKMYAGDSGTGKGGFYNTKYGNLYKKSATGWPK